MFPLSIDFQEKAERSHSKLVGGLCDFPTQQLHISPCSMNFDFKGRAKEQAA
jgi:hypothetical protein